MTVAEFTGSVHVQDGKTLVILAGEVDLASAPQLRTLLQEAVKSRAPAVVVDMALVSFCDAAGLGLLVGASQELRVMGGQFAVRAAPLSLRRLFQITGLTDVLMVEPATNAEGGLAVDLAAAARQSLTRGVLDTALSLVVNMSQSVMKGAGGVSITLPRDERLRTVAASNEVVLHMDHDQYDTGEGPCLAAATLGEPFHSASLEKERRWPHFVPRARARGIESIMSTPLISDRGPLGALNVYSREVNGLASHEQEWANKFAEQASKVLMAAHATVTGDSINHDLAGALRSRQTIALAQGIVMSRQRLQPDAAHRFLIDVSRRTSRPLVGICQEVVSMASPGRPESTSTAATYWEGGP